MSFLKSFSSGRSKTSKNKRGKKRNKLKVNTRSGSRRKKHQSSVLAFVVMIAMILSATGVLVWLGIDLAGGMLFADNDNFNIKNLIIKNGGPTTRDFITGKRQIAEGVNMFSFNIRELRNEFLRQAPNYKSMEISRKLPDTLIIEVFPRVPVARLGRKGGLVVDRDGFTFVSRSAPKDLPSLRKYDGVVRPGIQIGGMAIAALELLDACDDPRMGIEISLIAVDNDEYLLVDLKDGKIVKVDWDNKGERTLESEDALKIQLRMLAKFLRSSDSTGKTKVDLTYKNKIYAE